RFRAARQYGVRGGAGRACPGARPVPDHQPGDDALAAGLAEHHQLPGRPVRRPGAALAARGAQGPLLAVAGERRAPAGRLPAPAGGRGPPARLAPEVLMSAPPIDGPVVSLESAPAAEWAKHRSRAEPGLRRLMRSWLLAGKWHYFFLLLSDTGCLLAREKYS